MNNHSLLRRSLQNGWGTVFYFFCQWLLTIIIVRMAGFADQGVFALALGYANIFGVIAQYGVRPFQVSDVTRSITDGSFIATRGVTSAVSLVCFSVGLVFVRMDRIVMLCAIAIMVHKLLESFSDVLFGVFQQVDRYDAIAWSYTIKGLATLVAFGIALYFWGLLPACIAMSIAYVLILIFYDIPVMRRNGAYTSSCKKRDIFIILRSCFPVMLYTLINPYITFIVRYVIEMYYSKSVVGYYSSITIVITVMTTVAISIWGVFIPRAGKQFVAGQYTALRSDIMKIMAALLLVAVLGWAAGRLIGDFVLSLLFGPEILPYSYLLNPTIIVAVLLMCVTYFSSLLVALQKRTLMLLGNILGAIVCSVTIVPLIKSQGLIGACYCLGAGMAVQVVALFAVVIVTLWKKAGSQDVHKPV